MKKTKGFLVAAGLVLAMAFIFSCSSDDGDGGGTQGSVSSSSDGGGSSSIGGESEVKITKSKITGVSQKGPFVEGSTATLYELNNEFAQTGRSFRDIIADNKGSFEIKGVELISPYAMLEASGYYRNEVTGEVSKGPITLFAIADIREKDNVNVNLLTHLEYYRVLNLVESGKSVAEAKKQAQKEILAVFGINGDFENSEDMSIFGATEGDATLLAISVLLQGNLVEGEFSQRLTNFAQSVKESGNWGNEEAKAAMADWASTAGLAGIRSNIVGWGLSSEVPDFEKYVTDYWNVAYSLGGCGSANNGEVKKDNRNVYRICKNGNWMVASTLEYDTYQWVCLDANEREIKAGSVSSRDYVCENKAWRYATYLETGIQSVCLASNEGEIKIRNVSVTAGSSSSSWYEEIRSSSSEEIEGEGKEYICENRVWRIATEFERDIYKWVCSDANEGEIKAGNVSLKDYVCKNKGWVTATEFERDIYQWSCSDANDGEIKAGNVSGKDYICKNKGWVTATEFERDIYQWICSDSNMREVKKGRVSNKEYVCKYGIWQEPNYKDKYCFENGCEYFVDTRDKQQYVYVVIGEQTWMAENLNYAVEGSKCHSNNSANCDKYGRLYDWQTALISCPYGWHLPSQAEWESLGSDAKKLKAMSGWNDYNSVAFGIKSGNGTDEYGFSALPGGYGYPAGDFEGVDNEGYWWSASDDGYSSALHRIFFNSNEYAFWKNYGNSYLFSVRCLQD